MELAGPSGLRWVWRNGRGPHLEGRQEPQASSPFRLRPQGPCRVGTGESCLVLSEEGNPACLSSCQGFSGPWSSCVWNPRVFPDDARGCQCPFVLCLHPQGCLRRGVQARVLLKSGPGNRGHLSCGTTHVARLEFPCEIGLILRCTGKAGNPF